MAGLTLFALDNYRESAEYLERVSRLQPSDLTTLDLGKAYMRAENYKGTIDVVARLMAISPNSAEAHVMMGMAYDKTSRDREALAEYEAANRADPNYLFRLGKSKLTLNQQARQRSNYGRRLGAGDSGHQ